MTLSEITVSVLIPAYNEEESITGTVEAIRKYAGMVKAMEIIVINDGSRDRTGEIARTLPVTLIEHETNTGYGSGLKDGLRQAQYEFMRQLYEYLYPRDPNFQITDIIRPLVIMRWTDGRVVDCARLESVCARNSTEGSNPSLSASFIKP